MSRLAVATAAVAVAIPGALLCKAAAVLIRWASSPDI